MVVARAVVLAAGRGRRLGNLTASVPKPMLAIGDAPVIERIVAAIAKVGIQTVFVVTGYRAAAIETHLAAVSPVPIGFIRQETRNGTAGALKLARRAVGDDPFLLCWGDIATVPESFAAVTSAARPGLAGAVAINQSADIGGAVLFGDDMILSEIVEKPSSPPPSQWNSSGIMALTKPIWDCIDEVTESPRGELELTDAINGMIARGLQLRAVPITGPWFDIGNARSLEAARQTFRK